MVRFVPVGDPSRVGLAGVNERRYVLMYDADRFETGVALVNPNQSVPLTIAVTLRDLAGLTLSTETLTLPPLGHTAFMVSQSFSKSANRRGSLLLTASPSGVAALGLRFSPIGGTFTSFPALTSADIQP